MSGKKIKTENKALYIQKIEKERRKIKAVSYLFPLTSFILFYFSFRYILRNPVVPSTAQMIWAGGLGLLFPARGAMGRTIDLLLEDKNSQIEKIRVVYKAFNITSATILALLVFPLFYYSSFPEKVLIFFETFKNLSFVLIDNLLKTVAIFLSGISGIIGNILLGVLVNFIYDIGKSYYQKMLGRKSK